jgi:hypothetical protein
MFVPTVRVQMCSRSGMAWRFMVCAGCAAAPPKKVVPLLCRTCCTRQSKKTTRENHTRSHSLRCERLRDRRFLGLATGLRPLLELKSAMAPYRAVELTPIKVTWCV